jgi:hypothetical protein
MRGLIAATLVAVCTAARSTAAQENDRPELSWGLAGGASFPVGGVRKALKSSAHAAATLEVRTPYPGVALRLEGTYNYFRDRLPAMVVADSVGQSIGTITGGMRLLGVTANVVFRGPYREDPVRPYLVGGVGVFRVQRHSDFVAEHGRLRYTERARIRTGANAGLGLEVPRERVTAFAELRYHFVRGVFDRSALRIVPLSLGLRIH